MAQVSGTIIDVTGSPLTKTFRVFRNSASGVTAKDTISVTTDGSGDFDVSLVQGDYEFEVEDARLPFYVGGEAAYNLKDIVSLT